jgi:hypothetical protein
MTPGMPSTASSMRDSTERAAMWMIAPPSRRATASTASGARRTSSHSSAPKAAIQHQAAGVGGYVHHCQRLGRHDEHHGSDGQHDEEPDDGEDAVEDIHDWSFDAANAA